VISLAVGKIVATNRKALRDYNIEETYEAGLALQGSEVKSLRAGKVNLVDSYAVVKNAEVFLVNMHISPYEYDTVVRPEPKRTRKLLLHKKEIRRLIGKTEEKGYALVALRVYFSGRHAKVELGLGKGKKLFDKRREMADKTAKREIERAMKEKTR
jgi:SsrA-binding protein